MYWLRVASEVSTTKAAHTLAIHKVCGTAVCLLHRSNARPDKVKQMAALAFMLTVPGIKRSRSFRPNVHPTNTTNPVRATAMAAAGAFDRSFSIYRWWDCSIKVAYHIRNGS